MSDERTAIARVGLRTRCQACPWTEEYDGPWTGPAIQALLQSYRNHVRVHHPEIPPDDVGRGIQRLLELIAQR